MRLAWGARPRVDAVYAKIFLKYYGAGLPFCARALQSGPGEFFYGKSIAQPSEAPRGPPGEFYTDAFNNAKHRPPPLDYHFARLGEAACLSSPEVRAFPYSVLGRFPIQK